MRRLIITRQVIYGVNNEFNLFPQVNAASSIETSNIDRLIYLCINNVLITRWFIENFRLLVACFWYMTQSDLLDMHCQYNFYYANRIQRIYGNTSFELTSGDDVLSLDVYKLIIPFYMYSEG